MRCTCIVAFMILQAEALERPRLVYPRLLEERSAEGRLTLHVHDGLVLSLRKAVVAAPRFRVLTNENGRSVTHFYDGDEINRNLYEDENKLATLEVTKSHTGVTMRGLVGPHHRIQPMPVVEKSEDATVPHLIHEIQHNVFLDKVLTMGQENKTAIEERASGAPAEVPDIVFIEMFIVASKPHHHRFPNIEHLIWYLCVMTNFANLRLAQMSDPKIKVALVGIEKSQEEPYAFLVENEFLFDEPTIKDFKSYAVKNKANFGHPDVVFYLTGYDVFTIHEEKITTAGLGISYLAGLCTEFYVGLGEDMPGLFSGAHTLTHELAHLLGATHDGDGPDSNVPGHPSAVGCGWDRGNIMSYVNRGHEHHLFSQCSLQQMQYVVSLRGRACWMHKENAYSVHGTYPGMAVTFEQFCMGLVTKKKDVKYASVTVNRETCKVHCKYKKYVGDAYYSYSNYEAEEDALDFMPCGADGEVCIKGYCVPNPSGETKPTPPLPPTTVTTTQPPQIPTRPPQIPTRPPQIPTSPPETPAYCNPGCICDCTSSGTYHRPKNLEDIHLKQGRH
uniref:Putative tick metalloprotease 1 n=1 Tax=Amblyomma parvum TaxID=251391 RepID=A0A023G045_AMBPA